MISTDTAKQTIRKVVPAKILFIIRQTVYDFRSFFYKGAGYSCPVCDTSFSKMLDGGRDFEVLKRLHVVGGGSVKNNYCPKVTVQTPNTV